MGGAELEGAGAPTMGVEARNWEAVHSGGGPWRWGLLHSRQGWGSGVGCSQWGRLPVQRSWAVSSFPSDSKGGRPDLGRKPMEMAPSASWVFFTRVLPFPLSSPQLRTRRSVCCVCDLWYVTCSGKARGLPGTAGVTRAARLGGV